MFVWSFLLGQKGSVVCLILQWVHHSLAHLVMFCLALCWALGNELRYRDVPVLPSVLHVLAGCWECSRTHFEGMVGHGHLGIWDVLNGYQWAVKIGFWEDKKLTHRWRAGQGLEMGVSPHKCWSLLFSCDKAFGSTKGRLVRFLSPTPKLLCLTNNRITY